MSVSDSTLRRALDQAGIRKWVSRKKVHLTNDRAKKRLAFARFWQGKEDELLESIFSDESSIQNKSSNPGG
ncbi:hypothetical protein CDD82_2782 [Ophiocordyceps australis]|uniref:Transposase Tc1-like domain-containing protein n=1 Tax=Ophiocordyceps australis TaxID=1399860 RepID=A0A2C5XN76_9HYPO|nr:hypothetical protein CDD82_2782 [Ophiocordyceps australis]